MVNPNSARGFRDRGAIVFPWAGSISTRGAGGLAFGGIANFERGGTETKNFFISTSPNSLLDQCNTVLNGVEATLDLTCGG
jgi:hypothetical protein